MATWLRDRLERTRLPDEIVDRLSESARELHARHPRIFLDTAYEKPSPDFLANKIYPVLDRTPRLIVVSTPAAFEKVAGRDGGLNPNWLEREIERFLARSDPHAPSRPIDVVLGPGAPEDRFPGSLDANPAWDWADLRGFTRLRALGLTNVLDNAVVKLLAALYDVPPHLLPLVQREEERRRNRLLLRIGGVASLLFIVMSLLAVLAVGGQVAAKRAAADARAGLVAARVELSNAQTLAAARYRADGDELAAIRLLTEARATAPTPRMTAELLALPRPHVAFRRSITDAGRDGAWPFVFLPADGKLALGHFNGSVTARDPAASTGERVLLQSGGSPVVDLATTEDGSFLFVLRRTPADAAWNAGPGDSDIIVLPLSAPGATPLRLTPGPGEPGFLSLAVDAPGRALLVGTDRDVRVFNLSRTNPVPRMLGGEANAPFSAAAVALSRDGRYAAATSVLGEVRVWDLSAGGTMRRHQVPRPAAPFAYTTLSPRFDAAGRTLAFGSFDGAIHRWRVAEEAKPERWLDVHDGGVAALAWNPSGTLLATGGYDGIAALVDVASQRVISRLPMSVSGPVAAVVRLAFAPDDRGLAAGAAVAMSRSGVDQPGAWLFGAVRSWAIEKPADSSGLVLGFGFAADGRLAMWRQEGQAILLGGDFAGRTLACGSGLAWTPLAEGQRSRRPVQLFQAGNGDADLAGAVVAAGPHPPGIPLLGSAAIAPDGRLLAMLTGQIDQSGAAITNVRLVLCDTETGRPAREIAIPVPAASTLGPVLFDRNGTRTLLAVTVPPGETTGGGGARIFAVEATKDAPLLLGHWPQHALVSMAASTDGSTIALADDNGMLALLNSTHGNIAKAPEHLAGMPQHVTFDPGGNRLFAAGFGQLRGIRLAAEGLPGEERRAAVPTGFQATAISISPDGIILAIGEASGHVSLWETATFARLTRVHVHAGPVLALALGPDGGTLVSIGPDGARLSGRHIPAAPEMAERLTRLSARGAAIQPLDASREAALVSASPTADWPTAGDPAAAAFWRLLQEHGLRSVQPTNWWQWLWWSSPYELSPGLSDWKERHPNHPLTSALEVLAHGATKSETPQ